MVAIGKIFVLVYFMFKGIWISFGAIYFLVKINNCGGMGGPPSVENSTKFISFFYLNLHLARS